MQEKRIQEWPAARALSKVARFHQTFRLPIEDKPCIPSEKRCALRISLLEEELDELREAINEGDLVSAADAFCDLQYVLSGAILEFGMGSSFHRLFDEVQRSNMSKACQSAEEAEKTATYYKEVHKVECEIEKADSQTYLVYRKPDGKVLKSINYSPANLESLLT